MNRRKAVVIAVDGLRASALGAYGNGWYPTPALDGLASRSVVVDWMYREGVGLDTFYDEVWAGLTLPAELAALGVASSVIADDQHAAELAERAGIEAVLAIDSERAHSAEEIDQTALAALFAIAADGLDASEQDTIEQDPQHAGDLLWIHARAFHGAWDAPLPLRESLLDPDDPAPSTFVSPPARETIADEDALLGFRAAYAAQVMVLDDCLAGFLGALEDAGAAEDTLLVLVGCRGFALGEHGVVGAQATSLHSELLHVPCLVRPPRGDAAPPRWNQLATPRDLAATLLRWFGVRPSAPPAGDIGRDLLSLSPDAEPRTRIVAAGADGELAIRTAAWMLRLPPSADPSEGVSVTTAQLYVKPDDRWEANEVADRCADVAAQLLADAGLVAEQTQ